MNKEHLHPEGRPYTKEEFVEKIKTDKKFAGRFGNLGKIYGHQWRNWNDGIDQISELIKQLKENPDSRRLLLSAWNASDLPHQVLPPCHYGFQVYTRELSLEERENLMDKIYGLTKETRIVPWNILDINKANIPTRAISLMWNQRSCDLFLGIPFNIASYGLLLEIIAKAVNMVPDELIGNLGDVHLYSNHIEQAKEQIGRDHSVGERLEFLSEKKPDFDPETAFGIAKHIDSFCHYIIDEHEIPRRTREPYPLPKLNINSGNENWHLLDIDDIVNSLDVDLTFKLKNYQYHPTIKAPLSN
jgi:thymidylate synthase